MAHPIRFAPTPDIGSLELTEEIIQKRAYELFERRGCKHGHDVEDWLEAEAEVLGTKTLPEPEKATAPTMPTAA